MPLLNSFPGAEAAFSLRKLRSAHSGSAVRVRRDSDNAEQDIGFDGNDLDVDALESFCGSASGYVTKWYDQSGNSNDVLQTTAVRQPRIVATGTVDTDDSGVPTVVFDGVDDYLLSASITTLTQENTYFAVATLSDASTGTRTLIDGDSARNAIRQTTTSYAIFAGSAISAGSVDTSQHVWSALFNGANSVLRVDGVSTVTGNPGVAGLDMVVVGAESDGSNPWIGKISEVIVYDGDSSADFALIEANQSQREFEGSPMNTNYIWRGSVEPGRAGTGAGNVLTFWRGAVQPTDYGAIPDLSGLDEAAAIAAITAAGFAVGTITNTGSGGTVIAQSPAAATEQLLESSVGFTLEPAATGGRSKKGRKYSVEVDDEVFLFDTIAEAQEFLLLTRETAEVAAQKELQRAEKTKTPVKVPRVRVKLITGKPSASEKLAQAQADAERAIQEAYQKAAEARIQKLAQIAKDIPGKGIQTRADMSRKAKEKRQKQLDELEALIALLL